MHKDPSHFKWQETRWGVEGTCEEELGAGLLKPNICNESPGTLLRIYDPTRQGEPRVCKSLLGAAGAAGIMVKDLEFRRATWAARTEGAAY